MLRLPVEIWEQIFYILQWLYDASARDSRSWFNGTIMNLAHVNRPLYHIGLPYLYRQCVLRWTSTAIRYTTTLLTNHLTAPLVRHLSISCALDGFGKSGSKQDMLDLCQAISIALEYLNNLVSLRIQVYESEKHGRPLLFSDVYTIANILFLSPDRFPFHLELFSTNLPLTATLSRFLLCHPALNTFQLELPYLSAPEQPNIIQPTSFPRLTSIALTELRSMMVPRYISNLTMCIRHFGLHLELASYFGNGLTEHNMQNLVNWSRLESLTVFGSMPNEFWTILYGLFPSMMQLTSLSVELGCEERVPVFLEALRLVPNIKTVVLHDFYECYQPNALPFPPDLVVHPEFGLYMPIRANTPEGPAVVRVRLDGGWVYETIEGSGPPIVPGSRIVCDKGQHDPVKRLCVQSPYPWPLYDKWGEG